jgi:hypothetical protein
MGRWHREFGRARLVAKMFGQVDVPFVQKTFKMEDFSVAASGRTDGVYCLDDHTEKTSWKIWSALDGTFSEGDPQSLADALKQDMILLPRGLGILGSHPIPSDFDGKNFQSSNSSVCKTRQGQAQTVSGANETHFVFTGQGRVEVPFKY